jgi:bacterioferritin-associated ferredoxin
MKINNSLQKSLQRIIIVNYTVPGHPEGNGVAERKIQTLKNKANCLLDQIEDKNLKEILFNEALHHATYLVNITPYNSSCGKCPITVINGKIHIQPLLLRFGEKVITHSIDSLKYRNHIFIGYPKDHSQGYKIFDPQTKKHYRTTKIKSLIDRDINDRIKCDHISDKIDVLSYQNPKKKRKINF